MEVSRSSSVLSTKVIASALVAFAVIIISIFAAQGENMKSRASEAGLMAVDAPAREMQDDADRDGLKNWEESIWETSSDKADTDGDGTSDGDEVKVGRNPVKPGPNDNIEKTDFVNAQKSAGGYFYDDDSSLSTTEIIGRDFFSAYIAMQEVGQTNTLSKDEFAKEVAQKVADRVPAFQTPYTLRNAKIENVETAETYKTYANALGLVFSSYYSASSTNERMIIEAGMKSGNPEILKTLKPYVARNAAFAADMMKVTVPAALAADHVAIANDYAVAGQSLERIEDFFNDSLANISAMQIYQEALNDIGKRFLVIRNSLIARGITFAPSDPAYKYFGITSTR